MNLSKPDGGVGANNGGRLGEKFIRDRIEQRGYTPAEPDHRKKVLAALKAGVKAETLILPGVFYEQLPVARSIYGIVFKADFVIGPANGGKPILIEIKWQSTAGSVDEKLPFWLLTLEQLKTFTTVLAIMGDGARPGAKTWCHEYAEGKDLHVLTSTKTLTAYMATL